jgi:hypothetical protein
MVLRPIIFEPPSNIALTEAPESPNKAGAAHLALPYQCRDFKNGVP